MNTLLVLVLVAGSAIAGCTQEGTPPGTPVTPAPAQPSAAAPQSVAGPRTKALRVTVRGLDAVVLHEPRVVADSLVGMVDVSQWATRFVPSEG